LPPTVGLPSAAERRGDKTVFGSLSLDSFRAGWMLATEALGHNRTFSITYAGIRGPAQLRKRLD
jgi:hypothetical protein